MTMSSSRGGGVTAASNAPVARLLRGDHLCDACERPGSNQPLVRCAGICLRSFHASCFPATEETGAPPILSAEWVSAAYAHARANGDLATSVQDDEMGPPPPPPTQQQPLPPPPLPHRRIGRGALHDAVSPPSEAFTCADCREGAHPCFMCGGRAPDAELQRCAGVACGRFYHASCLKKSPHTKRDGSGRIYCPLHACHACGGSGRSKQCTRCLHCPTALHLKCFSAQAAGGAVAVSKHHFICAQCVQRKANAPPPPLPAKKPAAKRGGDSLKPAAKRVATEANDSKEEQEDDNRQSTILSGFKNR